jgi:hypothetical protein
MDNVDLGELNYRFEPAGQLLIGRGGMQAKGEDQGKGKRKHQVEGQEAGFLSWGSKKTRKAKKDTASHKGATKWKTFEGADVLLKSLIHRHGHGMFEFSSSLTVGVEATGCFEGEVIRDSRRGVFRSLAQWTKAIKGRTVSVKPVIYYLKKSLRQHETEAHETEALSCPGLQAEASTDCKQVGQSKEMGTQSGVRKFGALLKEHRVSASEEKRVVTSDGSPGDVQSSRYCNRKAGTSQEREQSEHVKEPYQEEVLGHSVKILFPFEREWFDGKIDQYDRETGQHHVMYDDGDEGWYDVRSERDRRYLRWKGPKPIRPEKNARKRLLQRLMTPREDSGHGESENNVKRLCVYRGGATPLLRGDADDKLDAPFPKRRGLCAVWG